MVNFEFGVICNSAIIDSRTEQVSIIGMIDSVQVESFPTIMPNTTIALFWKRSDSISNDDISFEFRMRRDPDLTGVIPGIGSVGYEQSIPSGKTKTRTILNIAGIFVNNEGINKFIFEIKDREEWIQAGIIELLVSLNPTPENTTSSPAGVSG
jgi:hypothetical protein